MLLNNKDFLRKKMLSKRKSQNHDMAKAKSIQAQNILMAQDFWQNAQSVALYMPIQAELDTALLLQNAWLHEKIVLLPRCQAHEVGLMDFFPCTEYSDLEAGKYNILEPKANIAPWQHSIDLIVLPALAFAKSGHRLGFGAGYYDRFLMLGKNTLSVGLAFTWQIIDDISIWSSWDMQVNVIVNEEGIIWI